LSKLDTLLTQENSKTPLGEAYSDNAIQTPLGFREWTVLIDNLVNTNHIEFTFQPVVFTTPHSTINHSASDNTVSNGDVLYYELFSKFLHNDEIVANNQLYSMAERTNKSQKLDELVLNKLARLTNVNLESKIAINLTHQSLHSVEFRHWLTHFIEKNKSNLPHLVFEINEEAILAGIDSSMHFIQFVKSLGVEVCIDRFGASFTSFKYLKGLDVDYLKIDGAYIHELELHLENKDFIQAVTQIGHSVGIKILTSHVESLETKQLLSELDCDGFQGNFIQKTLTLEIKGTNLSCIYSPIKLS
jgi:EAL domain-containing protein (putative c-di-GMP-specific phosphodiesterase class I)